MDDEVIGLEPLGRPSAGEDLNAVTRLLWTAGGIGMAEAAKGQYDAVLDRHALHASLAALQAAALLSPDTGPPRGQLGWHSKGFVALVAEAEQVLASRPIDEWPRGTSDLIVSVCDLVGDISNGGFDPRAR